MKNEEFSEARAVLAQSHALVVTTASTRQQAANLWDALRAFRKQAETRKEEMCRPLKVAWEDAKKPFDAFIKECQGYEAALSRKMNDYDREQARRAAEEQAKLQAKIDAQNARLIEKAEAKGVEPVLKTVPIIEAPPKSIETQAGTIQSRREKIIYGLKGISDNEELRANDERMKGLHAAYPSLFVFDWVAFRKLAATGLLDEQPVVERRKEYVYAQRG